MATGPTERDLILRLAKTRAGGTTTLPDAKWGELVRNVGKRKAHGVYLVLGQRVRLTKLGHGAL